MKYLKPLLYVLIVVSAALSATILFNGNLFFHTDIARDFLLVGDMVWNMNPELIGPRSSIPGFFHGPLWLYMQIPAFIIGQGNPVVVGWFWWMLSVASIGIVYWVGSQIFDKNVGLISAAVWSVMTIPYVKNMFNPFGAVMLAPVFIYLLVRYFEKYDVRFLIAALFVNGLMIQFQMAFAGPVLLLTIPLLGVLLWRAGKMWHMLSYGAVFIAQASFILFELRNNFFQTRSLIEYVQTETGASVAFVDKVIDRLLGFVLDGTGLFVPAHTSIMVVVFPIIAYLLYRVWRSGSSSSGFWGSGFSGRNMWITSYYGLVVYFYVGFWLASFVFDGPIWGYYYWPFAPLMVILLASLYKKKLFGVRVVAYVLALMVILHMWNGAKGALAVDEFAANAGSWTFNKMVAEEIFKDAPDEFGYFIFSPDLFGYTPRYPMQYVDERTPEKQGFEGEKRAVTYLLISPPPGDRPDLNGEWWRENQVKVYSAPVNVMLFENGFRVEKYELSEEQRAIEPDPNIIQTLHFR